MKSGPKPKDARERFWQKVRDGAAPAHCPDLGPCLEWTGARTSAGYGNFYAGKDQWTLAHRFAWEMEFGPVTPGMFALHRCDNRLCIRTAHLFLGDQQDNLDDAKRKGRQCRGSRNGSAKLTEDDVRSIRARAASGETRTAIANAFGITYFSVRLIVQRKRWSYLDA